MKKLLLILALTVPSFAFCTEPVESCVIVKQSYREVKQFSFQSKPRFTMKEKTIHCIIVQTALFAVGEYALQTRNKQLWNAYAITFVGTIPLSAIYLRKGKPSKGHYSY